MKIGKGWWIAGGVLLLWISPIVYSLVKSSCFPERVDQSRNWAVWSRTEKQRKIKERMAQWREISGGYYSYRSTYEQPQQSRCDGDSDVRVVYVDRPVVVERVVERPAYDSQPDLSGVYFNQPLKAGQGGYQNFQINYISGPH